MKYYPNYRKIYLIGTQGLNNIFKRENMRVIWANEDPLSLKEFDSKGKDHPYNQINLLHNDIDIVIVSTDYKVSFTKNALACYYI